MSCARIQPLLTEYACPATRCRQMQQQELAGKLLDTIDRLGEERVK